MIKRVRWKFILSSMASMSLCVILLIAVINVLDTVRMHHRMENALSEMIAAAEAVLDAPAEEDTTWELETYVEEQAPASDRSKKETNRFFGGRGGNWDKKNEDGKEGAKEKNDKQIVNHYYYYYQSSDKDEDLRNTALNQYAGRFFLVTFPAAGEAYADLSEASAMTEAEAIALGQRILEKQNETGELDDYRYRIKNTESEQRIYCLDCASEREEQRLLFTISCCVGAGGLILTFLFILLMSKKAVWPLKESMELQKRFITDAGHELKTPLAVIGTNMDILTMDIGKNEWVDGTRKQLNLLRKLVTNLISLAKLEEDLDILETQFFSVSETAAECADSFLGMAELSGKTLTTEIEPDLTVAGDVLTVGQLFSILCDNAVKYAKGDPNVTVRLYADGKKVIFETENDWTHNVPPAELERLFDRFYRGDKDRGKESGSGGFGLGLSIAKAIAEKNHAQLTVQENKQGRLVFRVIFKREKGPQGKNGTARENAE